MPALPVNQFQIASQLSSIYFSLALCPSVTEGRGEGGALGALDTGLETPGGHLGRAWTGLETERVCFDQQQWQEEGMEDFKWESIPLQTRPCHRFESGKSFAETVQDS